MIGACLFPVACADGELTESMCSNPEHSVWVLKDGVPSMEQVYGLTMTAHGVLVVLGSGSVLPVMVHLGAGSVIRRCRADLKGNKAYLLLLQRRIAAAEKWLLEDLPAMYGDRYAEKAE